MIHTKTKKKVLKLKRPFRIVIKLILVVLILVLVSFSFYRYQIKSITKLGYSEVASKKILVLLKKDYVSGIPYSETLNAAFESNDYKEEYLGNYQKITYQKQEHLIKNINTLIEKGYSNSNISLILSRGSDEDVTEFAKRDKVKYLEEFYDISYAKIKYYDQYVEYSKETGEDEETTVLYVNLGMNNDNYTNATVVKDFSTLMLVNKHFQLEKDFKPDNLVTIDEKYTNGEEQKGVGVAVKSFISMYEAAKREGLTLVINSSYRSYDDQEALCEEYRRWYGDNYVNRYVAYPGYSEHQTGLAFDIGSATSNVFANSEEYVWIKDNAYKYGFIYRFPQKGQTITGFRHEPWHYRYVGVEAAKYIYENNMTLEEYYAVFLDN